MWAPIGSQVDENEKIVKFEIKQFEKKSGSMQQFLKNLSQGTDDGCLWHDSSLADRVK